MSVNKVFDVDLDIKRPSSHRDFTVVNGDNGNRINVTLMDGDSPVDLTGCRIIAAFSRADGSTSLQDSGVQNGGITISPDDASKVTIDLFPPRSLPVLWNASFRYTPTLPFLPSSPPPASTLSAVKP